MLSTLRHRQPDTRSGHGSWSYRRIFLAIAAVVALLVGAHPAPALAETSPYGFDLVAVEFGRTEGHHAVQMFRRRHPDVSSERNVAAFLSKDGDVTWALVLANIGPHENNRPSTPIEIFRTDPNARDGWLRLTPNGQLVAWGQRGPPYDVLDRNVNPTFRGMDSERLAGLYMGQAGTAGDVSVIMTEREPCDINPNRCIRNIKPEFPAIAQVQFLVQGGDAGTRSLMAKNELWLASSGAIGPMPPDLFNSTNDVPAQGTAVNALAGQAGDDLGGVDLTTLELRYLADPGDGEALQYVFHAEEADGEDPDLGAGRTAAFHASDAFFVWLSLPRSTFWVNLDPLEPDRIIDPALATTDAGRILLEADLEMKKTVAGLIHPDTELGQRYWDVVPTGPQLCSTARMWIVPGPASVYEDNGGLYILDAPLEVRTEPIGVGSQHRASDPCVRPSGAPEPPDERFFRTEVLPFVEEAVNEAPEYAELRQVYLSRVAAEWYRQRSRHTDTRLASLIDSGNVSAWPALREWSPTDVFDAYVESFEEGEFDLIREHEDGSFIIETHYFYGGVELDQVELAHLDSSHFQENWAHLPTTIDQSLENLALDPAGGIWLGAISYPTVPDDQKEAAARPFPVRKVTTWVIAIVLALIVVGVFTAIVVVFTHGRRTRPRPLYPFR